MNRFCTRWTTLPTALLMAAPALLWAQQAGEPPKPATQPPQPAQLKAQAGDPTQMLCDLDLARAAKLIGKPVSDQQHQPLGQIKEIVIDPQHGVATFAILQLNGQPTQPAGQPQPQAQPAPTPLQPQRLVALPFEALALDPQMPGRVTVNVAREKIEQRPAFQESQYPQLQERAFVQQACEAFGFEPYFEKETQRPDAEARDAQPPAEMGARPAEPPQELSAKRVSELKGQAVHDPQDESLGQIHDMLIDMEEGRIAYLVLSLQEQEVVQIQTQPGQPEPAAQIERIVQQRLSLVPWAAVEFQAEKERLVVDTDRQTLERVAFSAGQWPNMADEQWARNLHRQFNEEPYWEVYGYPRYEEQRNGMTPQSQPQSPEPATPGRYGN